MPTNTNADSKDQSALQQEFVAIFNKAMERSHSDKLFDLNGDPDVTTANVMAIITAAAIYHSVYQKLMENPENAKLNPDQFGKIRSTVPESLKIASIMRKAHKNGDKAWMFTKRQELLGNQQFLTFLKYLGQHFVEVIKNDQTAVALSPDESEYLANLKENYMAAIKPPAKEKSKKTYDEPQAAVSDKKSSPAPVKPDVIPHLVVENTHKILEKIDSIDGNKYQAHRRLWQNSGIAADVKTLLAHTKPSKHQPLIEVLTTKPFIDMLLDSCAPSAPLAAITADALMLPKDTWSNSIHAGAKAADLYKKAYKDSKRTPVSEARLEIIQRFADRLASEQDPVLADAIKKIHSDIENREIPLQSLAR